MKEFIKKFTLVAMVILLCVAFAIVLNQFRNDVTDERELYNKIFNLDWSEHIPENYTGFEHFPYMKNEVFEYRDGWKAIKVDIKHNIHPWEDITVALRYDINTGEQIITYWWNDIEVKT